MTTVVWHLMNFTGMAALKLWECWRQKGTATLQKHIEKTQSGDGAGRKMINWAEGKDENGPELLVHVWSALVLRVF